MLTRATGWRRCSTLILMRLTSLHPAAALVVGQGVPERACKPAQVDLGSVKCALVVCDTEWRNCSSAEESGEEHLAAADYLRLDSMVSHTCSMGATRAHAPL